MEALPVSMDLTTNPFEDYDPDRVEKATGVEIGRMPRGTKSGAASVFMKGKLADGRCVVMETTLKLLGTAVDGMRAVKDEASN